MVWQKKGAAKKAFFSCEIKGLGTDPSQIGSLAKNGDSGGLTTKVWQKYKRDFTVYG